MSSQLISIYEQLLANKHITLNLSSEEDVQSIYSQLRTIKSRYERKFSEVLGSSISNNRVIRYTTAVACDGLTTSEAIQATFYLGPPVQRTKIQFTILE